MVNWAKTKAFWISRNAPKGATGGPLADLSWEPHTFKYLGVNVYWDEADVMEGNVRPALRKMQQDIEFWRALPLPAIGRVALAKMVSLVCLLYLFVMLLVRVRRPVF